MSKQSKQSKKNTKTNEAFLNSYAAIDKICCHKFGVATGGVTEYINRLINARFAPHRDEVLPSLVRYRNIRNRLAHEEGALGQIVEVSKGDLKWLSGFERDLNRKKDPISVYLRKARRYARRRKAAKVIITILVLAVIAGVAALLLL